MRDIGNTLIVVEHDEEIMLNSDYLIDIGPEAGINGGEIMFNDKTSKLNKSNSSLTTKYLNNELQINLPEIRRKSNDYIQLTGVKKNNINDIDVNFPLNSLTLITGVSGSGKSSLVKTF